MRNSFALPTLSKSSATAATTNHTLLYDMRKIAVSCLMIPLLVMMSSVSWGQKDFFQNAKTGWSGGDDQSSKAAEQIKSRNN